MQLPQEEEEDVEGMKQLLLSEIVAEEVRSHRSFRVLKHQEERLAALQNNLSTQSIQLSELQEDNADLIKVHERQIEVHGLLRELVKLQQTEYLTYITNTEKANGLQEGPLKAPEDDPPIKGSRSPRLGKLKEDEDESWPNSPAQERKSTYPTENLDKRKPSHFGPSPNADSSHQNMKSSKGDPRKIQKSEDASYFKTLKQSLGPLNDFLSGKGEGHHHDLNTQLNQKPDNTPRSPGPGAGSLKRSIYTTTGRRENENKEEQDTEENIIILRERLSSHRKSMDTLSDEIIDLRHERIELLTYLKDLLDWKENVEKSLKNVGINISGKNGGVAMHDANNNHTPNPNPAINTKSKPEPPPAPPQRKLTNLSVSPLVASNNDNDTGTFQKTEGSSLNVVKPQLGKRASQLWDLACKFFRPDQAHFLLTAPVPFNEFVSEGEP